MPDTKLDKKAGVGLNKEHVVSQDWAIVSGYMDELDEMRMRLPQLPGQLLKMFKMTDKVRGQNVWKNVREVPDFRCSYCDYQGTCNPDMSVRTIASLNDRGEYDLKQADVDVMELSRFVSNERKVWE